MRSAFVIALTATGCGVVAGIDVTAPPTTTERSTDFKLDNQSGTLTSLSELLARGDVALIFFRGHW